MSVGTPDGWSKHAALYADMSESATVPYARYIVAALRMPAASSAAPVRVLDVAAGPGVMSLELASRWGERVHVTVTDFAPGMVALASAEIAKLKLTNAVASVADALALPFGDGEFDVVISNFGIGVLREPEHSRAVAEALRVVKPGGQVLQTVWSLNHSASLPLPAHLTMISAMMIARGLPAPSLDGGVPKGLPFDTEESLREKYAPLLPQLAGLRIVDTRSSWALSVDMLTRTLLENPGTLSLVDAMSDSVRHEFGLKVERALMELTKAADRDEILFMGASANLVIMTKQ